MTRPDRTGFLCRDNAGVRAVRSINVTPGEVRRVTCSLVRVLPGRKLARGDLTGAVVAGTRRVRRRRTGTSVRTDYNGAVPLRRDGTPLPGRVYLPVPLESRWGPYSKVALLARSLL